MSTKREFLGLLKPDEVRVLADRLDLRVPDPGDRRALIEALLNARRATLNAIVPVLSRERRRQVCRALGIEERRAEGCIVDE
jgi:hypothetical protein